ncbi:MAG: RpiB/LacA/LacB family sugar-phosphate isomerase [Proteobacteria bacterium]|nr:RpiB/LacA/LacB family sugar-phosphate isomerase [Pseudomonadota bacterium]
MRIGLAADHAGFELKQFLLIELTRADFEVVDYGARSLNPGDDYPDFVIPMAKAVASGDLERGIAICGSGIGAVIVANKVRNARAGLVHDLFSAQQGVEDDNMNIICLAGSLDGFALIWELVETFLKSRYKAEPRFERRLLKIRQIENIEMLEKNA